MILQFSEGQDGIEEAWIKVGYVWSEEGLNDLHIQFDGPGADNFFPASSPDGFFLVPYRNKIYRFKTISFLSGKGKGKALSKSSLERSWISPNR